MKYYLLLTPIVFLSFSSKNRMFQEEKASIKFETLLIERKDIKYGTDNLFIFKFKNTGKVPLIIRVQTSCGCVKASGPKDPIPPKGKSEIEVMYDTKRVGMFTKSITVYPSIGEPIILTIKGNVLSAPVESDGEIKKN